MNFIDPFGLETSDATATKYNYYSGVPSEVQQSLGLVPNGIKISADITIERQNTGYGNKFDSVRTTVVTYSNGYSSTYVDNVGANAKDANFAQKHDGRTLPDGKYYVTTKGLQPQVDGSYDSGSYHNVLRLQTNDPNISKSDQKEINDDYYLFHPNQFKNSDAPYGPNPSSAGCPIVYGQDGQNAFMSQLDGISTGNISVTIKTKM